MYTIYVGFSRERIIMYIAKYMIGVGLLCASAFLVFCAIGKKYFGQKVNGEKKIKNRKKYAICGNIASFCSKYLHVAVTVFAGTVVFAIFAAAISCMVQIEGPSISSNGPKLDSPEGVVGTNEDLPTAGTEINDDTSTAGPEGKEDSGVEVPEEFEFSKVCIIGLHDFGNKITTADLQRFDHLYEEYWEDGAGQWKSDLWKEYFDSDSDIRQRIQNFDQEIMSRRDTLAPDDYMSNAADRINMYQRKGNIHMLEQAGISAEGAVETETIEESGNYGEMFYDMYVAMNCFCYVLAQSPQSYDSGTAGDVKYRVGKIMYKPFLNLKQLDQNDRYYSLCCSRVFLKDAFDSYNGMSSYAVETAYYYTINCKDMVMNMKPEDSGAVAAECSNAYTRFLELGIIDPDNPTFTKYKDDAKKAYEYVVSLGE